MHNVYLSWVWYMNLYKFHKEWQEKNHQLDHDTILARGVVYTKNDFTKVNGKIFYQ